MSTHHITALLLGETRSSLQWYLEIKKAIDTRAVPFTKHFVVFSVVLFYLHWLTAPLVWTSYILHVRLEVSKFLVEIIVDLATSIGCTALEGWTIVQYVCHSHQWFSACCNSETSDSISSFLNTGLPPQPPVCWVLGQFPRGKTCPGHEIKNEWSDISLLPCA